MAGSPVAAASAAALMRAFSSSVVPVSSTSGSAVMTGSALTASAMSSGDASRKPIVVGPMSIAYATIASPVCCTRISMISRVLSTLRVARTNGDGNSFMQATLSRPGGRRLGDHLLLRGDNLDDAVLREAEQRVELGARERDALGGSLHFHEAAVAGHHHVHVALGAHVFGVLEVEHRCAVDHSHRDRGDGPQNGMLLERAVRNETAARVVQRDPPAADRRGARAAIGLQDVAVDGELHLGHHAQVGGGAQRTADEALDLLRAAALLAL